MHGTELQSLNHSNQRQSKQNMYTSCLISIKYIHALIYPSWWWWFWHLYFYIWDYFSIWLFLGACDAHDGSDGFYQSINQTKPITISITKSIFSYYCFILLHVFIYFAFAFYHQQPLLPTRHMNFCDFDLLQNKMWHLRNDIKWFQSCNIP